MSTCMRSARALEAPAISCSVVTGRDSREDLVAGLGAGADDYMAKPIDLAELMARIGVGIRAAVVRACLKLS